MTTSRRIGSFTWWAALSVAMALVSCRPDPRTASPGPGTGETVVIDSPRLGVLNLLGDAARPLMSSDLQALEPLFGRPVGASCDVLMIYGRIDASGRVLDSPIGLRDIIRRSGARIVIVAMGNAVDSYIAAGRSTGYGRANLVMTLDRRGPRFARFFARLFAMMFAGETMEGAWITLAPQISGVEHDAPDTIFAAELGDVRFVGSAPHAPHTIEPH